MSISKEKEMVEHQLKAEMVRVRSQLAMQARALKSAEETMKSMMSKKCRGTADRQLLLKRWLAVYVERNWL